MLLLLPLACFVPFAPDTAEAIKVGPGLDLEGAISGYRITKEVTTVHMCSEGGTLHRVNGSTTRMQEA